MFAADPAHLRRDLVSAELRPCSVAGEAGRRHPFGMGSANSSSEYPHVLPQCAWNSPAPWVSSSGLWVNTPAYPGSASSASR